jgi:D-aspartate ligase
MGGLVDAVVLRTSPNSLSVVRSLGRAGLKVVVAATGSDAAVLRSRYVERFEHLPEIDDRSIGFYLPSLVRPGDRPFLMATGDQDAMLVAKHRERLAERFCFVSPPLEALEGIVDKARLYTTARAHGIPHPAFHVVSETPDIDEAIARVATPCYVKPALAHEWRRFRRGKLQRADSPAELRRILAEFVALRLTAIPIEIIPGDDGEVHSVTTYIDRHGRPVAWRTKRKIRQFPVDAGDGCAQEITDEPAVAELGLRLLAICGHRGPATVEFRRDSRDGRFVLMEINARTILGQEMIARSGLDAALLAYHDARGLELPATGAARPVRWIFFGPDFRAFKELHKRGAITTWQWLKSLMACRSYAYLALDDLGPWLARIAMWIGRRARGRSRRAPGANL